MQEIVSVTMPYKSEAIVDYIAGLFASGELERSGTHIFRLAQTFEANPEYTFAVGANKLERQGDKLKITASKNQTRLGAFLYLKECAAETRQTEGA